MTISDPAYRSRLQYLSDVIVQILPFALFTWEAFNSPVNFCVLGLGLQ